MEPLTGGTMPVLDMSDIDENGTLIPEKGLAAVTKTFSDPVVNVDENNMPTLDTSDIGDDGNIQKQTQAAASGNPLQGFVDNQVEKIQPLRTMINDMYWSGETSFENDTYLTEQVLKGVPFDDVEKHFGENKDAQLREQRLGKIAPDDWVLNTVRGGVGSLPYLIHMYQGSLKGSAIGATLGATGGAAVGATGAIATVEPLPIAAGALAGGTYGWNIGGTLGMLDVGTRVGFAKVLTHFKRLGATDQDAIGMAAVGGPLIGLINTSQFNMMSKAVKMSALEALNGKEHLVFNAMRTWFANATMQGVQEALDDGTPLALQTFRHFLTHKNVAPSVGEFISTLTTAFAQGYGTALFIGAAAQTTGHFAGVGLKNAMNMVVDTALGDTATEKKRKADNKKLLEGAIAEQEVKAELLNENDSANTRLYRAAEKLDKAEQDRKDAVDFLNIAESNLKTQQGPGLKQTGPGKFETVQRQPAKPELLQARYDAKQDLIKAQGAKRKATFELTLAKIAAAVEAGSATDAAREKARADTKAAKSEYRRAKLKQIQKMISERHKLLMAQLEENALSIQQRIGLNKPVEKLKKDALRLAGKVSDLARLEEIIQDPNLDEDYIDESIADIPHKSIQGMINRAIDNIEKTNRKTEAAVKKDKASYEKFLKTLIGKSDISDSVAKTLLGKISDAVDLDSLASVAEEINTAIQAAIAKADKDAATERLLDALDDVSPVTRQSRPTSEMTPQKQGILDKFTKFIKKPALARKIVEDYLDTDMDEQKATEDGRPTTPYDVAKDVELEIAKQTHNLETELDKDGDIKSFGEGTTTEQLNNLAATIELTGAIGKLERVEEQRAIKEDAHAKRDKAVEIIDRINPVSREDVREEKRPGLLKRAFDTLGAKSSSWTEFLRSLAPGTDNALDKLVDLEAAVDAELASNKKWRDRAIEIISKESGLTEKQIHDFFADTNIYKADFAESFESPDNSITGMSTIETTMAKWVNLYLDLKDPDLEAGLRADGYTYDGDLGTFGLSTQEVSEQVLGEKGKSIARGINKFYREYSIEENALNIKERGLPLDLTNTNYSGKVIRKGFEDSQGTNTDFRSSLNERIGLTSKSTIPRKKNSRRIVRQDAWARLESKINETEHWRHFGTSQAPGVGSIEYQLRTIYGDTRNNGVRDKLRVKFDNDMPNNVDVMYMNAVGTLRPQYAAKDGFMEAMRRATSKQALFNNPEQLFKQLTGAAMILRHPKMNVEKYLAGVADYWANKKKADAVLNQNGFFQSHSDHHEIATLKSFGGSGAISKIAAKTEALGAWALTSGVRWATRPTAWSLVKTLETEAGYTTEQAVQEASNFSKETQGSTLPGQTTIVEQTTLGKLTTAFTKPTRFAEQHIINSVRDMAAAPTKKNAAALVRSAVAAHFTMGLFQAVASVPALMAAQDEEERKKEYIKIEAATIRGPLGGFVMGEVINAGLIQVLAQQQGVQVKTWEPQAFYLQSALNMYKLMTRAIESQDEDYTPTDSDFLHNVEDVFKMAGVTPEPMGTFGRLMGAVAGRFRKEAKRKEESQ